MVCWVIPPVAGLIEPALAPTIDADAIGAIAWNNGTVTVYIYEEQMPIEGGATEPLRIVTGKIRGTARNIPMVIARLAEAMMPRFGKDRPPPPMIGSSGGPRLVR